MVFAPSRRRWLGGACIAVAVAVLFASAQIIFVRGPMGQETPEFTFEIRTPIALLSMAFTLVGIGFLVSSSRGIKKSLAYITKFKRFIYVGLVLGGGLFGCYIAWQQHAKYVLERLRPPNADQVRKWAGLPESTHLTMFTNIPADVWYGDQDLHLGKFKWVRAYEDRKGSNINCFVIAVYESGAFWPTNRAKFVHGLEQMHKEMLRRHQELLQGRKELIKPGTSDKEQEAIELATSPMTMPNGQKSYGFIMGLLPARFALHPEFDVLAYEFVSPISYDERHPPSERTETPTNSFYEFFTNVDAFLTSY